MGWLNPNALAYMKRGVPGGVGGVDACAEADQLEDDFFVAVKRSQVKCSLTYWKEMGFGRFLTSGLTFSTKNLVEFFFKLISDKLKTYIWLS